MPLDRDWSEEFPILRQLSFFNHAGVAPISGPAARALHQYILQAQTQAYHRSGWYQQALETKKMAAQLIGAQGPHEIALVSNTSTGLSCVAKGFPWRQGDQVIISNVEYPANRYPWQDLARFGVELVEVKQHPDGRIEVEDVLEAITNRTRIVSLSHVQYASGYRIDLKPIADVVHQAGGCLCVDAIQSLGALPVNVRESGIDFLSADGHKWLLSPEGAGIFYVREELIPLLHPNVVGWMNMKNASDYGNYRFEFQSDARRFEPGSYNIPGVLALGASLRMFLELGMDQVEQRIQQLTTHLCHGLISKGYTVFSPRRYPGERSGIVVFTPPRTVQDRMSLSQIACALEQKNIILAVREGRLRASPHFYNTFEQMDQLVAALPV